MTAEQQLERSVLESKERDELHAIAKAMDLKTTTRTKKADIIDRILAATGVGSNGANGVGTPPPREDAGATATQNGATGNGHRASFSFSPDDPGPDPIAVSSDDEGSFSASSGPDHPDADHSDADQVDVGRSEAGGSENRQVDSQTRPPRQGHQQNQQRGNSHQNQNQN